MRLLRLAASPSTPGARRPETLHGPETLRAAYASAPGLAGQGSRADPFTSFPRGTRPEAAAPPEVGRRVLLHSREVSVPGVQAPATPSFPLGLRPRQKRATPGAPLKRPGHLGAGLSLSPRPVGVGGTDSLRRSPRAQTGDGEAPQLQIHCDSLRRPPGEPQTACVPLAFPEAPRPTPGGHQLQTPQPGSPRHSRTGAREPPQSSARRAPCRATSTFPEPLHSLKGGAAAAVLGAALGHADGQVATWTAGSPTRGAGVVRQPQRARGTRRRAGRLRVREAATAAFGGPGWGQRWEGHVHEQDVAGPAGGVVGVRPEASGWQERNRPGARAPSHSRGTLRARAPLARLTVAFLPKRHTGQKRQRRSDTGALPATRARDPAPRPGTATRSEQKTHRPIPDEPDEKRTHGGLATKLREGPVHAAGASAARGACGKGHAAGRVTGEPPPARGHGPQDDNLVSFTAGGEVGLWRTRLL